MKRQVKKYELTDETNEQGLFRIKALRDFGGVKEGDLGGFIESEDNLSHKNNAWVFDNALVSDNARVFGNTRVYDNALVHGNALISDNARVYGDAQVHDNARVSGNARVFDNTRVFGNALISGIMRSDGYAFIAVPCSDGLVRVIAGCRYFTFEEAYDHWNKTRKGTLLGDETMIILNMMNEMVKLKGYSG